MAKIKNLLFDLGGVLLNIDYNKTADAFRSLGVHNFDELYSQHSANKLFELLETGHISEPAFYETMQQFCDPQTSQQQIESAWNAMLLNFRTASLYRLERLKDKYHIYLLSNTNSIHHTAFTKILAEEAGGRQLDNYFTRAYYSHKIFKRKPYPETYQYVLELAGLQAGETLFIDDSINNIEGAKEAGLAVHHLHVGQQIEDIDW